MEVVTTCQNIVVALEVSVQLFVDSGAWKRDRVQFFEELNMGKNCGFYVVPEFFTLLPLFKVTVDQHHVVDLNQRMFEPVITLKHGWFLWIYPGQLPHIKEHHVVRELEIV